mgnify:CR=1 FL=1
MLIQNVDSKCWFKMLILIQMLIQIQMLILIKKVILIQMLIQNIDFDILYQN